MPEYLRFLHGLVDSEDLPLNVSRETLQDNSVIRRIRTSIVKGVLDRLDKLAQEDPEAFRTFYGQFGAMLKEGPDRRPAQPRADRQAAAVRARRAARAPRRWSRSTSTSRGCPRGRSGSTTWAGPTSPRSPRAPTSRSSADAGIEVLFLTDPIDEFAITSLRVYQGKTLTSIDSADLELPDTPDAAGSEHEATEPDAEAKESGFARVLDLFRAALGTASRRSASRSG